MTHSIAACTPRLRWENANNPGVAIPKSSWRGFGGGTPPLASQEIFASRAGARCLAPDRSSVGVSVALEPSPVEAGDLGSLADGPVPRPRFRGASRSSGARQRSVFLVGQARDHAAQRLGDRLGAAQGEARLQDRRLDAREDLQERRHGIRLESLVGLVDHSRHALDGPAVGPAPLRSRRLGDVPVSFLDRSASKGCRWVVRTSARSHRRIRRGSYSWDFMTTRPGRVRLAILPRSSLEIARPRADFWSSGTASWWRWTFQYAVARGATPSSFRASLAYASWAVLPHRADPAAITTRPHSRSVGKGSCFGSIVGYGSFPSTSQERRVRLLVDSLGSFCAQDFSDTSNDGVGGREPPEAAGASFDGVDLALEAVATAW
ncbi:hypothetical protein ACHAWF_012160 [Thalassiosira exigua]